MYLDAWLSLKSGHSNLFMWKKLALLSWLQLRLESKQKILQVQETLEPHQFAFLTDLMIIIGRVENRESVVQLLICRKSKLATVKLSSNSDEAATYSSTKCIMGGLIFDWSSPFSRGTSPVRYGPF